MMIDLRFAVDVTPDGLHHVTNVVMGMRGQHMFIPKKAMNVGKRRGTSQTIG